MFRELLQSVYNKCIPDIQPLKDKVHFAAHCRSSGKLLWMQYLSKSSKILGEDVV
jgi:hypothetical protein